MVLFSVLHQRCRDAKNMKLYNHELPSCEDVPSLAWVVRCGLVLSNVTGDLGPLLSSLACTQLWIENMEQDQAATNSLVGALQHGVQELQLGCDSGRVRLHTQTLVNRRAVNERLQYFTVLGECPYYLLLLLFSPTYHNRITARLHTPAELGCPGLHLSVVSGAIIVIFLKFSTLFFTGSLISLILEINETCGWKGSGGGCPCLCAGY